MKREPTVPVAAKPVGSRLLHVIDRSAARPAVAMTIVGVDLAWMVFSAFRGFPAGADTVFQTLVAALTLALVFVIQHTQTREQRVVQRKLDEILRSLPEASNRFIALETGSDVELDAAGATHLDLRGDAV